QENAMTALKWCRVTVLLALAIAPATGAPLPFRHRTEHNQLLGTWKRVGCYYEGRDQMGGGANRSTWVIGPDTITLFSPGKVNGGSWRSRIDASGKPTAIDLDPGGPPGTGPYPCVYKLEGDRLTLLLQNFPKNGRPRDFDSWSAPGVGQHVMVRVKSGEIE